MLARLVLAAFVALAALPAGAYAAPVPDRVLDEVSAPMDVSVGGSVVAYTRRVGTRGVEVVVRDGDRPAVRLAAGRGFSAVDVGRDARGKRVVVYQRCMQRCALVAYSLSAARSRDLGGSVARATDLTVGAGRVFWADGRRVRSRAFDGGRDRTEAVAGRMKPTELDTDAKTLAVTGQIPFDTGNGATGLSVTRPGSGRARLRGERAYAEEYAAIRAPVVTGTGVTTLFDVFTSDVATRFAEFAAGKRGFEERGTGGMKVLTWARDGANAVFVEAPTDAGCVIGDPFTDQVVGRAPCRIVRANLAAERVLPPRISIDRRTATVLRPTVRGSTITGRLGEAGVAVEVRDRANLVAMLVTDAQGRVTLPAADSEKAYAIVAATTPRSYAIYSG